MEAEQQEHDAPKDLQTGHTDGAGVARRTSSIDAAEPSVCLPVHVLQPADALSNAPAALPQTYRNGVLVDVRRQVAPPDDRRACVVARCIARASSV